MGVDRAIGMSAVGLGCVDSRNNAIFRANTSIPKEYSRVRIWSLIGLAVVLQLRSCF
jgi:hypothetical protein